METTSDDIILPEVDVESHIDPIKPKRIKKSTLLAIIISAAFIALVSALVYVIVANNEAQNQPPDVPRGQSFRYNESFFNEAIDEAEENIAKGDYLTARAQLNQYTLPERMTAAQKYRYYTVLAALYAPDAMNDAELYTQYQNLASQSLEEIRKGE